MEIDSDGGQRTARMSIPNGAHDFNGNQPPTPQTARVNFPAAQSEEAKRGSSTAGGTRVLRESIVSVEKEREKEEDTET